MKFKKIIRIFRLLGVMSLAVGAIAMSSCVDPYIYGGHQGKSNKDGSSYKKSLEAAISRADRIVVVEHSHQSDFYGLVPTTIAVPSYKYGSKDLTPEDKSAMLIDVRRMRSAGKIANQNCSIAPHYTIELYEHGRLSSKMKICFQCNDVAWGGANGIVPADLLSALAPAIRSAGFSTTNDWRVKAASRYTPQEAKPDVNPTGPPTAVKIPGKPGFVYNPFNKNEVDVDGIPPGTKVRDPFDPDQSHIFRVP